MPRRYLSGLLALILVLLGCDSDGVSRIHSTDVTYDIDAPDSPVPNPTTRPRPILTLSATSVLVGDELTVCGRDFRDSNTPLDFHLFMNVVGDRSMVWDGGQIALGSDDVWCRTVVVPDRIRSQYGGPAWLLSSGEYTVVVNRGDLPNDLPLATATVTVGGVDQGPFTEPSQNPEDAVRDQVVPNLAEMPVAERVGFGNTRNSTEGLWVLSEPKPSEIQCLGECRGDPDRLRYGIDFIALSEYSEVLLMDPTGTRILRAFPMPGLPADEMLVTDDAVFTGRVGDGGIPCSSLVRIDRETFELEAYVFPCSDGNEPLAVEVWLDGWELLAEYPRGVRNPDYSFNVGALEEFFASVG